MKAKKLYKGRKPALNKSNVAKRKQIEVDGVRKVQMAKELGISRMSVYVSLIGERLPF